MHAEMHALCCQDQSYLASINDLGDQTHTHTSLLVLWRKIGSCQAQSRKLISKVNFKLGEKSQWINGFSLPQFPPFFLTPEESDVAVHSDEKAELTLSMGEPVLPAELSSTRLKATAVCSSPMAASFLEARILLHLHCGQGKGLSKKEGQLISHYHLQSCMIGKCPQIKQRD